MTIAQEYVRWIDQTAWYVHKGERNAKELSYILHGSSGENGETSDVFKKVIREVGFDDHARFTAIMQDWGAQKVLDETCDQMWYIAATCAYLGITIEELMLYNMVKVHKRLTEGVWNYEAVKYRLGGKVEWPLKDLPYDEALKLTQHIEFRITAPNATTSTDIDTR